MLSALIMRSDVEDVFREILKYYGENPNRSGLKDTPRRVVDTYAELLRGYKDKMPELTAFKSDYNQMIVASQIECISLCEHHLLPILIEANVGYIPNKKVVGISKIPRLVQWCCARLVIQEDLTETIADILEKNLEPHGVIVVLKGRHLCTEIRGVRTKSIMTTSSIRGAFKKPIFEGLHPVEEFLRHCQEAKK